MCRPITTNSRRYRHPSDPPDPESRPESEPESVVVEVPDGTVLVWWDGWKTVELGWGEKN